MQASTSTKQHGRRKRTEACCAREQHAGSSRLARTSKKVNFLDLTISSKNNKISTKTFQKAMDMYQYLSPRSNHPPGMIKDIIYSLLKTHKTKIHTLKTTWTSL